LWFEYVPAVGSSQIGQLVHYFEPDPSDLQATGASQLYKASEAKGGGIFNCWSRSICTYKPEKRFTDLFTSAGTDIRLNAAGQYVCAIITSPGNSVNCGTIYMHYSIKFYKPLLEIPNTGFEAEYQWSYSTTNPGTNPLGNLTTNYITNNLAVSYNTTNGGTFTFNQTGVYQILIRYNGVHVTSGTQTGSFTLVNCTQTSNNTAIAATSDCACAQLVVLNVTATPATASTFVMTGTLSSSGSTNNLLVNISTVSSALSATKSKEDTILEDKIELLTKRLELLSMRLEKDEESREEPPSELDEGDVAVSKPKRVLSRPLSRTGNSVKG